jgi:hypothetical protein
MDERYSERRAFRPAGADRTIKAPDAIQLACAATAGVDVCPVTVDRGGRRGLRSGCVQNLTLASFSVTCACIDAGTCAANVWITAALSGWPYDGWSGRIAR